MKFCTKVLSYLPVCEVFYLGVKFAHLVLSFIPRYVRSNLQQLWLYQYITNHGLLCWYEVPLFTFCEVGVNSTCT
jgi:hypothetical protein